MHSPAVLLRLAFVLSCVWLAAGFVRRQGSDAKLSVATGTLDDGGRFGSAVTVLHEGLIAVGQEGAPGGGVRRGSVWLAKVSPSSAVQSYEVVNATAFIGDEARFGASLATLRTPSSGEDSFLLAVGACEGECVCLQLPCTDHLGYGSVYLLTLRHSGEVLSPVVRITEGQSGLSVGLQLGDAFGRSIASADVDGDGRRELVVSAQTCPTGFTRDLADGRCKNSVSARSSALPRPRA